jgi:hypothetical protein
MFMEEIQRQPNQADKAGMDQPQGGLAKRRTRRAEGDLVALPVKVEDADGEDGSINMLSDDDWLSDVEGSDAVSPVPSGIKMEDPDREDEPAWMRDESAPREAGDSVVQTVKGEDADGMDESVEMSDEDSLSDVGEPDASRPDSRIVKKEDPETEDESAGMRDGTPPDGAEASDADRNTPVQSDPADTFFYRPASGKSLRFLKRDAAFCVFAEFLSEEDDMSTFEEGMKRFWALCADRKENIERTRKDFADTVIDSVEERMARGVSRDRLSPCVGSISGRPCRIISRVF